MQYIQTYFKYLTEMKSTTTAPTANNKYTPPAKRNNGESQPSPQTQTPHATPWNKMSTFNKSAVTEKKQPKKEFALTTNAFPTLGETITNGAGKPLMSFSSVTSKSINKNNAAMSAEEEEAKAKATSDLLSGWVYIRKNQETGQVQYRGGLSDEYLMKRFKAENEDFLKTGKIVTKYLIERLQYERDMDVERLGDLSEYFNSPTVNELLEELYQRSLVRDGYNTHNNNNNNNNNNEMMLCID